MPTVQAEFAAPFRPGAVYAAPPPVYAAPPRISVAPPRVSAARPTFSDAPAPPVFAAPPPVFDVPPLPRAYFAGSESDALSRPLLDRSAGAEITPRQATSPRPHPHKSHTGLPLKHSPRPDSGVGDAGDILQFASSVVYVTEDKSYVSLHLIRLGNMVGPCSVSYRMEGLSAKDGERFNGHEGAHDPATGQQGGSSRVCFEDLEYDKEIRVEIIQSDGWASQEEFIVILSDPVNCSVGQYLSECRVKIIDLDPFPSPKYEDELKAGPEGVYKISGFGLYVEYIRLLITSEGMKWRTLTLLLFNQMENIYLAYTLYVNVYVVDVLFNPEEAGDHGANLPFSPLPSLGLRTKEEATAAALGCMYLAPMALLHVWDYVKTHMDVGGKVCDYLRINLFQKFLSYSESSRLQVPTSIMQVSITSDCQDLADGYMATVQLMTIFGKLAILVIFILKENFGAVWCVILMPTMMAIWITLRSSLVAKAAYKVSAQRAKLIETVNEACNKYRLIADYGQRSRMCDLFSEHNEAWSEKSLRLEEVLLNNHYFPKWLGPLFIGFYIWHGSHSVVDGTLTVGTYVAMIRIFHELSEEFSDGYALIMKVANAQGPAQKLAVLFNYESESTKQMAVTVERDARTRTIFHSVIDNSPDIYGNTDRSDMGLSATGKNRKVGKHFSKIDEINIQLDGVSYGFKTANKEGDSHVAVLNRIKFKVPQGHLIALIGPHGAGKNILLRLIGQAVFPDVAPEPETKEAAGQPEIMKMRTKSRITPGHGVFKKGFVFIPTHLRILHVGQDPMLLNLSVLDNLLFGLPEEEDKSLYREAARRAKDILEMLEMTQTLAFFLPELAKLEEHHHEQRRASGRRGSVQAGQGRASVRQSVRTPMRNDRRKSTLTNIGFLGANYQKQPDGDDSDCSSDYESMPTMEFDEEAAQWQDTLTASEKAKIHLARALVVNPEVLVLQRPFMHYNEVAALRVISALQTHVEQRGIGEPAETKSTRRPRTCFYTPSSKDQASAADTVLVLQGSAADKQRCREVDKSQLDDIYHKIHLHDRGKPGATQMFGVVPT